MFFHGRDQEQARQDYQALLELTRTNDFPCRAKLHLSRRQSAAGDKYVLALIYPAEYEEEVAQWLTQAGYQGGQLASGGISQVEEYYRHYSKIQSRQLWGVLDKTARDAAEVLANLGKAVVR